MSDWNLTSHMATDTATKSKRMAFAALFAAVGLD